MAFTYNLQIRRNTNAYRLTITLLPGELYFCTDTSMVYVGNGTTPGGVAVTSGTSADGISKLRGTFLIPFNVASFSVPITSSSVPSQVLITIRRPLGAPIIYGTVVDPVSSSSFTVELTATTNSTNQYKCDWQALI